MTTDTAADRLTGPWIFNAMHSVAEFSIPFVVHTFRSRFEQFSATLDDGKLSGEVQVASLAIGEDHGFKSHVMAADFFDVETYPTLSFATETLSIDGDDVVLDGTLTIKGVTEPVRATGTIGGPTLDSNGFTLLGFTLTAAVDRHAFGLNWNPELPGGGPTLAGSVDLVVELEFMKMP